jgi:schlafen family protein
MAKDASAQLSLERLKSLLDSPCEMTSLDFKETVNPTISRDRVELAKDVLAMANSGGGHIIVGIEDGSRRWVGIDAEVAAALRDAKSVNDQLKKYCGGFIRVLVALHKVRSPEGRLVLFGLLYVPGVSGKIPAQADGVYPDPVNQAKQKWSFRRGDVYVRKGDESVKAETPADLEPVQPTSELEIEPAREMIRAYAERLNKHLSHDLPALRVAETSGEMCGESLINALLTPRDILLIGPSGSGKSLHLKHFCVKTLKQNQLPLLAFGGLYKGAGLSSLVDSGIAPFSKEDTKTLCKAASLCGVSVVLIIDGLNECQPFLEALGREIESFRLRYASRLILSTQEIHLPADGFGCEHIFMAPLTTSQKRFVFCYHAKLEPTADVDYLCQSFSNGYDLAVAGRCYDKNNVEYTRVELYDRYCRESLPQQAVTVLAALLRDIAGQMGEEVTTFWPRYRFEQHAERFLLQQKSPLGLLDELRTSRLVTITNDSFAFEHELLLDYFRADQLSRKSTTPELLAAELAKPKNQALLPFVLCRQSEATTVRVLFAAVSEAEPFHEIIRGWSGQVAKNTLIAELKKVYSDAEAELSRIELCFTVDEPKADALSVFSFGFNQSRDRTQYELLLLDVIATSLDEIELQPLFFELLDLTQWALRDKARVLAEQSGISFNRIWAGVVGQLGIWGGQQPAFMRIAARLRENLMHGHRQDKFCLEDELWERVNRDPGDYFSLDVLLNCLTYSWPNRRDLDRHIVAAKFSWDSKIYSLRMSALQSLQFIRWRLHDLQPEELQRVQQLLAKFETKNLFLNSFLLEVQTSYGVWKPPVSVEQAVKELRAVISESPDDTSKSDQELFGRAYSLLSNIFEDIFQGAYYHAYESLSTDEKSELLTLAAQVESTGFTTPWILHELLEHSSESALPVFKRFASSIDASSHSPWEAATMFAFGIQGCARFMNDAPKYEGPSTAEHLAWKTVGSILFWLSRSSRQWQVTMSPVERLWDRLTGPVRLAAVDVLYSLHHGLRVVYTETADELDLAIRFPLVVRTLLEDGLKNRHSLTSVFSAFPPSGNRKTDVALFAIKQLGRIGNEATISVLQEVLDDAKLGAEAIAAIQQIRKTRQSQK